MKPSPSVSCKSRFAPLLLVLASAAITVAAYLQALNYPFVDDDATYILQNTKLAGLHLTELWRLFTEPYNRFSEFLPLRDLSYWFDMTLFGLNPAAFRLHNILLYLLCLPLVYATTLELWRYFRPAGAASAPWAAAAATALFVLHPAHIEAVVWVSGRKEVLPNLFSILALWLALRARRERGFFAPHAAATLIAFAAVMLSKVLYIAVAPVIALLWVAFWLDIPAQDRRRAQLLWPLAILLLAGFMAWIFILTGSAQKAFVYFGVEAATRSLAVLGWLARLAVSPESRHFFYPVFEDAYLYAMVALGCAVLAGGAVGGVMLLRKRSLEGFALAAFLLLCVPHMQLIPYGSPSLASDRWLTLAVWPAALLLVALSWRLKPVPRTILLLAIALSWGLQTIERPRDWRSNEALIDVDLRAYPGHYLPAFQKIIGVHLAQGLNRDAAETASRIADPEMRNIMIGLIKSDYAVRANAVDTGDPRSAIASLKSMELTLKQPPAQARWNSPIFYVWKFCRTALAMQWHYLAERFPGDVSVRYNTGLWMLDIHKFEYAADHLRAATELQRLPEHMRGTAFMNLGLALIKSGHVAEAEIPLHAALAQLPPDTQAYCLLSEVYKQAKRLDEAANAEAGCRSRASNAK